MSQTFIEACKRGDMDCLDKFENITEEEMLEGINEAYDFGHSSLVEKLVLHISPSKMDNRLLMKAIENNNNMEMIRSLSHLGIDLFLPNEFVNPIITAVEEDRVDIFEFLLSLNFDKKKKNILFTILVQLDHSKYVYQLLKDGDIDPFFNYQGRDPLSYAIRKENYDTLKVLLEDRRIKVTFEDLLQAVNRPNPEIIKLLLSYYPDNLERYDDLIQTASNKDHYLVLDVLFRDLRINPWSIKVSSNQIKQILNNVKEDYVSQQAYNEQHKVFQRYFQICENLQKNEIDLMEMEDKMLSKSNHGYLYIRRCLEENRFEHCSLKKKLGLLC